MEVIVNFTFHFFRINASMSAHVQPGDEKPNREGGLVRTVFLSQRP
jgi:hypothetical protein